VISIKVVESDHTWIVLEGSVEGFPQVTHRRSIHAAALASGDITLADEKAKLIADVETACIRWLAVQKALNEL
jgi:hypothetical protein